MNNLESALPSAERALLLKKNSAQSLSESLQYLIAELYEAGIIDQKSHKQYEQHLKRCQRPNLSHFLVNDQIIAMIDRQQIDSSAVQELLGSMSDTSGNNQCSLYRYGDPLFSETVWRYAQDAMRDHLPQKTSVLKPDPNGFEQTCSSISRSLEILKGRLPDIHDEMLVFLDSVIIFKSGRLVAGSSFSILGNIYLKQELSVSRTIDFLIHETAHQYLFHVSAFDELCLNAFEELYTSPLRKDKRPMIGVYHAVFVLARLIYSLKKLLDIPEVNRYGQLTKKLRTYQHRFDDSIKLIEKSAKLTTLGKNLIVSCKEIV